jgi:CheY-like chemotaxis protein
MELVSKRIFVVEDNIDNRIVYRMILIEHGAMVEFDRWGLETASRLQRFGRCDLIILDLMLGRASGYGVFEHLKQLPCAKGIPVVAVSASDPETAMPKAREMGFSGYIAKPIDQDLFPRQLAGLIRGEAIWYDGTFSVQGRVAGG